jgi:hypothetical protein
LTRQPIRRNCVSDRNSVIYSPISDAAIFSPCFDCFSRVDGDNLIVTTAARKHFRSLHKAKSGTARRSIVLVEILQFCVLIYLMSHSLIGLCRSADDGAKFTAPSRAPSIASAFCFCLRRFRATRAPLRWTGDFLASCTTISAENRRKFLSFLDFIIDAEELEKFAL